MIIEQYMSQVILTFQLKMEYFFYIVLDKFREYIFTACEIFMSII